MLATAALLLPWLIFGPYRALFNDPTCLQDLMIFLATGLITNRTILAFWPLVVALVAAWTLSRRQRWRLTRASTIQAVHGAKGSTESASMRPMIFPSRTTHTRLFPKVHSFGYSYLLVGVAVGEAGPANRLLSTTSSSSAWFRVDAADYLSRNDDGLDLEGKLHAYLKTQAVDPAQYPYAYLVTAPRVLGYSFNPVSFWYLYDKSRRLQSMILEVNNTFDERRVYFLQDDPNSTTPFSATWAKDFHVSPFNSRKGTYDLSAHDPQPFIGQPVKGIDNRITLKSSGHHAKLVARIFSTADPMDVTNLSALQSMLVMAAYAWSGFLTFPRILLEAWRLHFRRKLHVWFRPEVTPRSIARTATGMERGLESYFARYLAHAAARMPLDVRLAYAPPDGMGYPQVLHGQRVQRKNGDTETEVAGAASLQVLTPAFYLDFVLHRCPRAIIQHDNPQVALGQPDVVAAILIPTDASLLRPARMHWANQCRWAFLAWLRCVWSRRGFPTPGSPNYPAAQALEGDLVPCPDGVTVDKLWPSSLSPMDAYILSHCNDYAIYRRNVSLLLLAHICTGGFVLPVQAADVVCRLIPTLFAWWLHTTRTTISFACPMRLREAQVPAWDLLSFAGISLAATAPHLWSVTKGL